MRRYHLACSLAFLICLAAAWPGLGQARAAEVLYLNLNDKGELRIAADQPPLKGEAIKKYVDQQYQRAAKAAQAQGLKEVQTLVIIRAESGTLAKDVFETLALCKQAGFQRIQIRAVQSRD